METTDNKNSFWKKAGWTGLTILPVVSSLALQLIVVFAAAIVIGVLVGIAAGINGVQDTGIVNQMMTDRLVDAQSVILSIYHILALVLFGLWYYFGCGRPKPQKPGKVLSGRVVAVAVFMGLFMCISGTAYLLSAEYVVPDLIHEYEEMIESAGLGIDPIAILTSIFIAPIGEELLCRGVTFHYADKVVKGMANRTAAFWIANVMQALMFGIMHANLVQGSYTFVMGLGLGWLRWRYHSLYPSMLAHFAINFSSTFIVGFLFYVIPETLLAYLTVMLIGIGIVVTVALCENERIAKYGY